MTEDTLHLVLETLTVVIKVDAEAAAAWEPQITPAVLQIWAANVTDPLLALDAQEVLEALAASPAVLPALQVRLFTTFGEGLNFCVGRMSDWVWASQIAASALPNFYIFNAS